MIRQVALFVSAVTLAGCSTNPKEAPCSERFAKFAKGFASIGQSQTADFTFDAGEPDEAKVHLKDPAKLTAVMGNGRDATEEFKEQDFGDRPSILMADGKTFVGVRWSAQNAESAIQQGCALESRYGTLRAIRLNAGNASIVMKNGQ